MDPSDLRAEVAERLANSTPIDAETFNAACFLLSRSIDELELTAEEAAPLIRRLLRIAGRVVIDTAPGAQPDAWPEARLMAVEWLAEALAPLGYELRPTDEA